MTIKAKLNQNIMDLALRYYGSIEGLLRIVTDNHGFTYNTNIAAGNEVKITDFEATKKTRRIITELESRKSELASGMFEENTFNNSYNNSFS